MHQIAPFQNPFCKNFLGRGSPSHLPNPSPALVTGFALDSGFALNSWALRALDSGFALSFHAILSGRARFIHYAKNLGKLFFILPSYATACNNLYGCYFGRLHGLTRLTHLDPKMGTLKFARIAKNSDTNGLYEKTKFLCGPISANFCARCSAMVNLSLKKQF